MKEMLTNSDSTDWIDITYALSPNMQYLPTDNIPPHLDWVIDPAIGSACYMYQYCINGHNGTHVETARHFDPNKTSVDKMPLTAIIGPARVIEIKDSVSINPEELETHNIQPGERILFKTINSSYYKMEHFVDYYCYLTLEAARFLAEKKVSVVGFDYLGLGPYSTVTFGEKELNPFDKVRATLLDSGVWLLGAIDLYSVEPGQYEIFCLPIKILDGDAAPARAVLRPLK